MLLVFLQYHKYRKSFKEILQQEKVLDEARKREAMHTTKMNRVQKQVKMKTNETCFSSMDT